MPPWVGNLPFPRGQKRPAVITREMEISTVYGNPPHQIRVQKYISTDRITFGDFEVKPGDCFDPPDIHPGCEFYYLLGGVATVLNPHSGMAYQVRQGEGFLIAPNTWHQVHNFTDQNVAIMGVIAPAIWSEDELGSEIEYLEEPRYYKVNLEVEGPWPKPGGPEPDTGMTVLKSDHLRHLIHGRQYHVLVSLLASNQYLHAGFITLPTRAFSEPESHRGDEVVCAMDGPLMIKVLDQEVGGRSVSQVCYEVLEGQKCLIPESEGALAGWSDFPVPRYLKH
jgi:mannose-6-phosphate isomerase-like protein (cupin superfamily)